MTKKDIIYVTGHEGFVGSNLVRKLWDKDLNVIISGIDLLNQSDTEAFIKINEPDYVFMCAAIVGGIKANIENPYKFLYENLQIQCNIINSAIKYGVKKVLFLGSACIYPTDHEQPLKECHLMDSKLEPTNEGYSLAKIAGLKMCEYANRQSKTKFVSLMPCGIYGQGDNFKNENSHVIPALIRKIYKAKKENKRSVKIWGSGNITREFLHVDDLTDCMIWAMKLKIDTFINVGVGKAIRIKDLVDIIVNLIGYEGKIAWDKSKPDGMKNRCLDISKVTKLGWKAKVGLKEGLGKTIKYYEGLYDKTE